MAAPHALVAVGAEHPFADGLRRGNTDQVRSPVRAEQDTHRRIFRGVVLSNLTCGSIFAPLAFELNRDSGLRAPIPKNLVSQRVPHGVGANVITVAEFAMSTRMLAIYKVAGKWQIFDGQDEHDLENVEVTWKQSRTLLPGFVSFATLTLATKASQVVVDYFRPTLRQWFEDGWTLDDIDIAHLIARVSKNPDGLQRLDHALQMRDGAEDAAS